MSLKLTTRGILEQNIDSLIRMETLAKIERIANSYIDKGLIDKKSRRDVMLMYVLANIGGIMAGAKSVLEPAMSEDDYLGEIIGILNRRAPEIRDAILMHLGE
ncbi:MAG: hypothetical protein H3Z50_00270 [archaeon]|nr:hypothetical protein [archaeon]